MLRLVDSLFHMCMEAKTWMIDSIYVNITALDRHCMVAMCQHEYDKCSMLSMRNGGVNFVYISAPLATSYSSGWPFRAHRKA